MASPQHPANDAANAHALTPADWKTLAGFGILTLALGMYDAKLALYLVGVASAVIIVKNADKIGEVLP